MGQPITVAAGPLAAASATNIAASQAGVAAKPVVLNGSTTDATATAVAAAQAVAGAGNLTINGTLASGGIAQLGSFNNVYITSAGNDSGITFTVYGTGVDANGSFGQVETVTGANTGIVATLAKFATVTRVAASGAAAGNVSVGKFIKATLDTPRRVIITSAGNDSAKTFAVTGTDGSGQIISETVTGANAGAASTVLIYKTITSIIPSAATASTITVGTNGVTTTRWVRMDDYASLSEVFGQVTVSGTVNYTVQQTMQDPNDPVNPIADEAVAWIDCADTGVVAATATKQWVYAIAPIWVRCVLNSSTGTGSLAMTLRQTYTG